MTTMRWPAWTHDMLGEAPHPIEVGLTVLLGVGAATWFVLWHGAASVPLWRVGCAGLLAADVAAGCVGNFTRSTNDYYAARPLHRWLFIAVHGHIVAITWLLGEPLGAGVAVWGFTIASATVVNAAAGTSVQPFLGGAAMAVGTVLVTAQHLDAAMTAISLLFVTKLVYAFAVDHYFLVARESGDGIVTLTHRDRRAFVRLIASSFLHDPLFVAVVGSAGPESNRRAEAFAASLFDAITWTGGTAQGVVVNGELVAASLVEPPRTPLLRLFGAVVMALRFVSTGFMLGGRETRLLNTYFARVRDSAPRTPHHYLTMVGVAPHARGRGYGRRLIDVALLAAAKDGRSAGVALDTENPANVAYYERLGFRVQATLSLDAFCSVVLFAPCETPPPS